jgi:hypothetical protein
MQSLKCVEVMLLEAKLTHTVLMFCLRAIGLCFRKRKIIANILYTSGKF